MEEFDQPDQYEQFQPPPGPPQPAYWNAYDDKALAETEQGIAKVQQDLDNAQVHPEYALPMLAELHQKRQALDGRKQATLQEAKRQAVQEATEQNAVRQSLVQADAAHDAQNFQARTARYTHPTTGQTADLYQKRPGEWEQIDFGEAPADAGGAEESAAPPQKPLFTRESWDGRQEIYNGPHRSVTTYDENGRTVKQEHYDPQGNLLVPQDQQAGAPQADLLSPAERAEARRAALQTVGQEPQQFVMGRHGPMHNPAHTVWAKGVEQQTEHYLDAARRARQHTADAATRQTAAEQRTQAQKDLAEHKKKLAEDRDLSAKQKQDFYYKELDRLKADRAQHVKDGTLDGAPDYLKDDKAMEDKAHERAEAAHKRYYPHRQEQAEGAGGTPRSSEPAQAPQQAQPAAAQAGPRLVQQQTAKLDLIEKQVDPQNAEAKAALAGLRSLIQAHGGDLSGAPAKVKQQAKEYTDVLRKAAPPRPTEEQMKKPARAFGPVTFAPFGH